MNSEPNPRAFLFCTPGEWTTILGGGGIAALVAWLSYGTVSGVIGFGLFLAVATVLHMGFSARFIIPFPHIAILISLLQYVMAAWVSYYFPTGNPHYDIGARLPLYLSFGSGAALAFAAGWAASLLGVKAHRPQPARGSDRLLRELDILFWVGLGSGLLSRFIDRPGLSFLLLLVANLRYVGALGRVLLNASGWRWRIGATLLIEVLLAARAGMFHALVLWALSFVAVYLYRFRPTLRVVLAATLVGVVLLPALQEAKWKLRERTWFDDTVVEGGDGRGSLWTLAAALGWVKDLAEGCYDTVTLSWDKEFLADTAVRYNQGWIVNRVMLTVPFEEPYARGQTIVAAVKDALLARALAPAKAIAGGKANMERFAGMAMGGTSMNLGYAGELYANFGYRGAIAGCFVYAVLLGLLFRWVAHRAAVSPLWWVFVPYVGTMAFKAEEGISEVLNWVTKAAVVAAAVYFLFPAIRAALSGRPEVAPRTVSARDRRRGRAPRTLPGDGLQRPPRGANPRLGESLRPAATEVPQVPRAPNTPT